jgi:hypothetical protein
MSINLARVAIHDSIYHLPPPSSSTLRVRLIVQNLRTLVEIVQGINPTRITLEEALYKGAFRPCILNSCMHLARVYRSMVFFSLP